MKRLSVSRWAVISLATALWLIFALMTSWGTVWAQSGHPLLGGARGRVRSATGAHLEGMMVQLISHQTAIRTTVYSDQEGLYEFPKLEPGLYTLRIARPLEFRPYRRDSVQINEAPQLEDIVLERVSDSQFLPPTPEILGQLTDAEWLWNLPGTAQEKRVFSYTCGSGCHTYQWTFRARYDERSWRLIVDRMVHYRQRTLFRPRTTPAGQGGLLQSEEDFELIWRWLARVRAPESKDPPMQVFQGPREAATRVIVTEYELPSVDDRPHDVVGDSEGNIWYTPNMIPYLGKLDPRTGVVKYYKVPRTPGEQSGSHWLDIDKDGLVLFTETWAGNLVRFDPKTEEFHKITGFGGGNRGLTRDGFLFSASEGKIRKFDSKTGKVVQEWPLKRSRGTYGNFVTPDGRFFAGGTPWQKDFDGVVFLDALTGEVREVETRSRASDASRGGFDPEGNAWMGGRGGILVKYDPKTGQLSEYLSPTPYITMYEAKPDMNGEVWIGMQRGGRIGRFNPKTGLRIEYVLPEPLSLNWRSWIDNSTDPVTFWYGEHNGYIVRLQPLE